MKHRGVTDELVTTMDQIACNTSFPSNPPSYRRSKILAVDDTPENLTVIECLLASSNVSVQCVLSGAAALSELARDDFAMVLLDVAMPEMNGFEVVRAMRCHPKTLSTPVVFVTAHRREDFPDYVNLNTNLDILYKPISPAQLREKVNTVLAKVNAAAL
jgi:CheY-like chemotaxis protein